MTFNEYIAEQWDLHPVTAGDLVHFLSSLEPILRDASARRGLKAFCHKMAMDIQAQAMEHPGKQQFVLLTGRAQQLHLLPDNLAENVEGIIRLREVFNRAQEDA